MCNEMHGQRNVISCYVVNARNYWVVIQIKANSCGTKLQTVFIQMSQFIPSAWQHTTLYLLTPWSRVLLEKLTGSAASQEIPHILWNPKFHYLTQQVPATSPCLEPTPSSPHNPLPLPEDPS